MQNNENKVFFETIKKYVLMDKIFYCFFILILFYSSFLFFFTILTNPISTSYHNQFHLLKANLRYINIEIEKIKKDLIEINKGGKIGNEKRNNQ